MKYNVEQSIIIDKNAEEVFEIISQFKYWALWSPWNITDPEVVNGYDGDGDEYGDIMSWDGPLAGIGEMEVTDYQDESYIAYELRFKKPFPSKAFVSFNLNESVDGTTELTWAMEGNLPIFMFWMKKQIIGFVNNDFKRGMRMIKEYAETGTITSHLEHLGTTDFDVVTLLSRTNSVSESEMSIEMPKDINAVLENAAEEKISVSRAFSVYVKSDMANERYDYVTGFEIPSDTVTDYDTYTIAGGKYMVVRHSGSYQHLGNGWVYGYMYVRVNKVKLDKKRKPFELYVTGPNADSTKHVVDIYIPIR